MIHVIVRERDAIAQATEPITSGSVGLECSFRFSADWDGLGKAAIFQGGGQIVDVFLETDSCVVPHEVLRRALGHLKIGVYGTGEQGQRVTPTVWADAGRILPGAEPSQIEPTPATQSLVQQILEAAENAAELAQSVRDDADAGEFDGEKGDKGDKGDTGERGPMGPRGQIGPQGERGQQGPMGPRGPMGYTGLQGPIGPTGPQGPQGPKGDKGDTGDKGDKGDKGDAGEVSADQLYAVFASETASGPIASFPDGADVIPVKDLSVSIEPVQSGSGDPSPDNIRPISGWTGAEVTRTGRNLLDTKNFAPTSSKSSGITLVQNQDGSFKASGTATGTVNLWLRGSWGGTNPVLKLYAGKTYFIKDCMLYNGTSVIGPYIYMGNSGTYTPTIDTVVTGVRASCPVGTTLDQTIYPYVTDSSDTEWQEFGDTYSITFPTEAGTVYGGTLDVTTGKLTVDRAMVDLGTLTWTYRSAPAYPYFLSNNLMATAKPVPNTSTVANLICSIYKAANINDPYQGVVTNCAVVNTTGQLYVYDARFTDTTAFAEAMSGVQLVYELATPIVYDLTPTEVTTLLAQNNIWADCGDSTVEYRADTKLYIDKKIAALAAAMN